MKRVLKNKEARTYLVFFRGSRRPLGQTTAVSPEKAIANCWWNKIKHRNPLTITDTRPEDLDAVEI